MKYLVGLLVFVIIVGVACSSPSAPTPSPVASTPVVTAGTPLSLSDYSAKTIVASLRVVMALEEVERLASQADVTSSRWQVAMIAAADEVIAQARAHNLLVPPAVARPAHNRFTEAMGVLIESMTLLKTSVVTRDPATLLRAIDLLDEVDRLLSEATALIPK